MENRDDAKGTASALGNVEVASPVQVIADGWQVERIVPPDVTVSSNCMLREPPHMFPKPMFAIGRSQSSGDNTMTKNGVGDSDIALRHVVTNC